MARQNSSRFHGLQSAWRCRAVPIACRVVVLSQLGLAAITLTACGDYAADYPQLAPTDQLLAPPKIPAHAADAASSPDAVDRALHSDHASVVARADRALRQGAGSGDLAERATALRARAASLSKTQIDGEDGALAPTQPPETPGLTDGVSTPDGQPAPSTQQTAPATSVCPSENRDCAGPSNP